MDTPETCKAEECDKPTTARGLCTKHYYGAKSAGTLDEVAPKIHPPCERCGGEIPQARRYGAKFCSTSCKDAEMDSRKVAAVAERRGPRRTECTWCQTPIDQVRSDQRFCSRKCADDWRNDQTRLRTLRAKKALDRPCEVCGEQIPAARPTQAIYCSPECKRVGLMSSPKARTAMIEANRNRLYGITMAQYRDMLTEQGGVCAICRTNEWPGKGPHVDHDHKTGKVRGILCHKCNLGLGKFNDDVALMREAIKYLELHAT